MNNEEAYKEFKANKRSKQLLELDPDLQSLFYGMPIDEIRDYEIDEILRLQEIRNFKRLIESLHQIGSEIVLHLK